MFYFNFDKMAKIVHPFKTSPVTLDFGEHILTINLCNE